MGAIESPKRANRLLRWQGRWIVAWRLALRTVRHDPRRTVAAVSLISIPVVLAIVGANAWVIMTSARYPAAEWLGADRDIVGVVSRVARSSITQDALGSSVTIVGNEELDADAANNALNEWVPKGDSLIRVDVLTAARLSRTDFSASTLVSETIQTARLDVPPIDISDPPPLLDRRHILISADLAQELSATAGDSLIVDASSGHPLVSQSVHVTVDRVIDGERRMILGADTITLSSFAPSIDSATSWYVRGAAPITWEDIERINAYGFLVISRDVIINPPPTANTGIAYQQEWQVLVLIVAVLLVFVELLLLVTPIFAVAQNAASRTAAILLSIGGDRGDQRRLLLAHGLHIGLMSSAVTIVLTLVANAIISSTWGWGISRIPWPSVISALVVPFILSIIASIKPARDLASVDAVAVIAGRVRTPSGMVRRIVFYPIALVASLALLFIAAEHGSIALLLIGIALLEMGIIGSIPYLITIRWSAIAAAPIGIRLAARDAVRNGHRTLPAMASLLTTAFIACTLLITLTSTNTAVWNSTPHLGPRGSVFIGDADASASPSQAALTQELAVKEIGAKATIVSDAPVRGAAVRSERYGPDTAVEALFIDGTTFSAPREADAIEELDLVYIVDDGTYLSASGLVRDDELERVTAALQEGGAIIPASSSQVGIKSVTLRSLDMTGTVSARAEGKSKIPPPVVVSSINVPVELASLNVIVLSPQAADRLDLPVRTLGHLLILDRPVTVLGSQSFATAIAQQAPGTSITVIQPDLASSALPHGAAFISLFAALGTVALVVVLAGGDMRSDFDVLEAIGASSKLRMRIPLLEGVGLALVCVPIAVVSGLAAGVLIVVTLDRSGILGDLVLTPVIPWTEVIVSAVATPVIAAIAAVAARPKGFSRIRRID